MTGVAQSLDNNDFIMKSAKQPAKTLKVLVFAHTPPPHHGQSVMVQALLSGLQSDPRFEVHHVNARVSDDMEDVGSLRLRKIFRLAKYIAQAWWLRVRHGAMVFYYVPAPAKRSAIVRDWLVMALCRPLFPKLLLHWHAYGLGEWTEERNDWMRRITRKFLGRADLSIVLSKYNIRDAEVFRPRSMRVISNGIPDIFPDYISCVQSARAARTEILKRIQSAQGCHPKFVRFLFLGHLMESKGVHIAVEAAEQLNAKLRADGAAWRAHLQLAGQFASEEEKTKLVSAVEKANRRAVEEGAFIEFSGFLDAEAKRTALKAADALLFPTYYEGETQGLVLLEAMSAGLPVVASAWRGVAEVLPDAYPFVVEPKSASDLAEAMAGIPGLFGWGEQLRRHFEKFYRIENHVAALKQELLSFEHESNP